MTAAFCSMSEEIFMDDIVSIQLIRIAHLLVFVTETNWYSY